MLTQKEISVLDYLASHSHPGKSITLNPSDTICGLSNEECNLIFDSLCDKGYITQRKYLHNGRSVSLTYSGFSYKEHEEINMQSPSQVINNFNAPVTNSAISNTGNVTMNITSSFDDMRSEINSHDLDSSDREIALKLIDCLETLIENDAPLKKGALSKFSDVISKHSWLFTLCGNALTKYFIG